MEMICANCGYTDSIEDQALDTAQCPYCGGWEFESLADLGDQPSAPF